MGEKCRRVAETLGQVLLCQVAALEPIFMPCPESFGERVALVGRRDFASGKFGHAEPFIRSVSAFR